MEHYSFEFWIRVGFESWWCDLGLPKVERSREKENFLNTQFWGKNGRSYKNFEVENHKSCFDIQNILIVVLIFSTKHGIFL
jgi:hypothetical protein